MKQQMEQIVNSKRDEMIEATKRLVKIESLKGDPKPQMPFGEGPDNALREALTIAKELGFSTENHQGYVGTVDFSDKPAGLDILVHLDVVPAPPEDWTVTQPFEPMVKDGKLYGRGTSDDKGPAICALYAMQAVRDLGVPLKKNVRLIFGTDEESGSEDIAYYYKKHDTAPYTVSPDANFPVINVEKGRLNAAVTGSYPKPTGPRVVKIHCGVRPNVVPDKATASLAGLQKEQILPFIEDWEKATKLSAVIQEEGEQLLLTVSGVGGHAAYPHQANNALTGLLSLVAALPLGHSQQHQQLQALAALFPHGDWSGNALGIARKDAISGDLTLSFTILHLDETSFRGEFDSRTSLEANKANTEGVAGKFVEDAGLAMETLSTDVPHHVPAESPFIQTLLNAYETYTGNKGYTSATGGGTYVHGLENAVAFGPTMPHTETNIHGADEFAVIEELLLATMIYAQVIIDLCS